MAVEIVSVIDEGLGHAGHLVSIDRMVLVIDPLRSVGPYINEIARRGWRLRWTADTHTHADYVSGSPELARLGAKFFASGDAHLEMPHHALAGGHEVDLGNVTMRALSTPGHTPDHLAYLLFEDGSPFAVFTGGSLMVGTVGRTDLFGPQHADQMARDLWRSIQSQLMSLPDDVVVYPTHGAGSFCAAPASAARVTTIGQERLTNPLLLAHDEDEFVRRLLGDLGPLPSYFEMLPERNRVGVGPAVKLPLRQLSIAELVELKAHGAELIDVRSVASFAAAHVPNSISIPLRPAFAPSLGAVVPLGSQLVFVTDQDTDRNDLVRQCNNVGHDRIAGELAGGIDEWKASGLQTESFALVRAEHLTTRVLDVRTDAEFRAGHIPGAEHIDLLSVAERAGEVDQPVIIMCGHGERAATAASILARHGATAVSIVVGGPADWAAGAGLTLANEA
jgi:glyoxylase-like metal-dependent hydrolase (beta-lactamase superfamily II)